MHILGPLFAPIFNLSIWPTFTRGFQSSCSYHQFSNCSFPDRKRLSQFSASFQRQFTGIQNEVVRVKRIKGILFHQSDSIGNEVYCKIALLSFKVRRQLRNITQRILKLVFPLSVLQNLWDWSFFLCFYLHEWE